MTKYYKNLPFFLIFILVMMVIFLLGLKLINN